jgi:hypothetical protein
VTLPLVAFAVPDLPQLEIVPAARSRPDPPGLQPMCLPMSCANQLGWAVLNDCTFSAVWDGRSEPGGVIITSGGRPTVMPNFGAGFLTWQLPYLIRLPASWSLLLRGPSNAPKDGAAALEGLVEGDGYVSGASIVWKLTRPGLPVRFAAGEPIGMLVPVQRGQLEEFAPEIRDLRDDLELAAEYLAWRRGRMRQITQHHGEKITPGTCDKGYWRGAEQKRLHLREFADRRRAP